MLDCFYFVFCQSSFKRIYDDDDDTQTDHGKFKPTDDKIPQMGVRSGLCTHLFNFWDPPMVPGTSYLVGFYLG